MRNFTCGPSKADSRTRSSFGGRKNKVFAIETLPSAHEISHLVLLLVWIRSESIHHNLRSPFAKPLLIVRFFLRLKELKKNYAKRAKSSAILIKSFDETCFRNLCIFGGHCPRCASLHGICFSECVN